MSTQDPTPTDAAVAYRMGFGPSDNPFACGTSERKVWDREYWAEHDASADFSESGGIEEAYGNFWDGNDGRYDDDPSPYDGNYSEM